MSTELDATLREIVEVVDALDALAEALAALHLRRNSLMAEANANGTTVVELSKLARISRPAVYAGMRIASPTNRRQLSIFESVEPEVAARVEHVGRWLAEGGPFLNE